MTEKEQNDFVGCIVALVMLPFELVIGALLSGWALVKLWSWFIVPVFPIRGITILEAIGISLVASFLTHQMGNPDDDEEWPKLIIRSLFRAVLSPLFSLLIGYIVIQFK